MGSRMAANLLAAGHDVAVWNRTPEAAASLLKAGARLADTPSAAATEADVVIAMVRDDEASRKIWLSSVDGALYAMSPDGIGIESSTLSVSWTRALASAFADRRRGFLDAPVLGSRLQAEAAELVHVVGGEPETLDYARPVLAAMGKAVHHMGPAGSGTAMKLMLNALLGIQVAALAELLGASRAMGLDMRKTVAVLGQVPVCSPAAKGAAEGMAARLFAPAFPVDLIEKDLGYLAREAAGCALPLNAAARAVFERAIRDGHGADNMTAVAQLYS